MGQPHHKRSIHFLINHWRRYEPGKHGQGHHSRSRHDVCLLAIPAGGSTIHRHCQSSLGGCLSRQTLCDSRLYPQVVQGVSVSQGALLDIFERIENVFRRLETYTELPPTKEMTDIIIKVMVEMLLILALVTKEIKQGKLSGLILDN